MNSLTHTSGHHHRPVNSSGFFPQSVKCVAITSLPFYGYNPLRWLIGRPKYYLRVYSFESQPAEVK